MNNNTIKYKNTNNDFVPQIPENWELRKIKFASSLQSGFAFKSSEYSEEGYPVFRIGDILDEININNCPKYPIAKSKGLVDFRVYNGDILIALTGATIGKTALIKNLENFGLLNQRVAKLEKPTKFLYYSFLSKPIQEQIKLISNGSAQENISNKTIENFYIPFPSADQQIAIANFLDKKCEQINQFIADKKQLINLLKEQRQSVIDAHFSKLSQLVKLKYLLTKMGSGVTPKGGANVYKQSGIYFLRSQNIHNDGLRLENVAFITKDVHRNMTSSQVKKNDVLINITGASIGRCFTYQLDDEANINQHICIMRPDLDMINPQFLMYQIQSTRIQNLIDMVEGASREGLTNVVLKNYPIAMTSLEDQLQIINKIKEETKTIDETIFKTEEELRLVSEYKEALISNAVTGQLHIA